MFRDETVTDSSRMRLPPITREMIEEKARQILRGEPVAPFSSLMTKAADARFSVRVNPTLREDVAAALNTDRAKGEIVKGEKRVVFCDTPGLLMAVGMPDAKIYSKAYVLRKVEREHGVTADQIVGIPKLINDPVAIFDDYGKGYVVLTTAQTPDEDGALAPLAIIIRPDEEGNYIASAYSRKEASEAKYVGFVRDGKVLYLDKNKVTDLTLRGEAQSSLSTFSIGDDVLTADDYASWPTPDSMPQSAEVVNPARAEVGPADERQLSPENEAVRHSIIIGANRSNARRDPNRAVRLSEALRMLDDIGEYTDRARDEIYVETGWWRGVDGKWRVEIPNVKPKARVGRTRDGMVNGLRVDGSGVMRCRIGDIANAPDLFDAYPQLRNIDVVIRDPDSDEMEGVNGFYDGEAISIGWDCVKWINDEPSNVLNEDGVKTLTHEIQHVVQDIEGFAYGGNQEAYGKRNYTRLAGEVEARNAERRNTNYRMYGGFARLASPGADPDLRTWAVENGNAPWQTEDVPQAKQLITYGDGSMTDINGKPVAHHSIVSLPGGKEISASDAWQYRRPDGNLQDTRYSKFLAKSGGTGETSAEINSVLDRLQAGIHVDTEEIEATPEWSAAKLRAKAVEDEIKRKYGVSETRDISTPERNALRKAIIGAALGTTVKRTVSVPGLDVPFVMNEALKDGESYEVKRERKVCVIIGLPSAGKSSVFANALSKHYSARVCDSDAVKKVLPEFDEGYGGNAVHEESSDINLGILNASIARGENIVYPILGYKAEKLRGVLDLFRKNGYSVQLYFNELSAEKAKARLLMRFLDNGRYLPLTCITKAGDTTINSYNEVKNETDEYAHCSNDVHFGSDPEIIESSVGTEDLARRLQFRGRTADLQAGSVRTGQGPVRTPGAVGGSGLQSGRTEAARGVGEANGASVDDVEADARRSVRRMVQDGDRQEAQEALESYVAYFKLAHGPLPRPRTLARRTYGIIPAWNALPFRSGPSRSTVQSSHATARPGSSIPAAKPNASPTPSPVSVSCRRPSCSPTRTSTTSAASPACARPSRRCRSTSAMRTARCWAIH